MSEGDGIVGAVEGPEPGNGAESFCVGPLGELGDVGVGAAEDEGGDAGGLPGAEVGGGEVGIVGVDPQGDGGREGLGSPDGVGGEADTAPVLGGVDGGLAGGRPDGVALVAGGGVVDAREVHAHLGAGGRGRAGAGMVGVADNGGPGPGDLDAPALVVGVVVEGALEGDGGLQALDVPIVQGQALRVAVGRGEEEIPDGAQLVDLQLQIVAAAGEGVDEHLEVVVAVDDAVALGEGGAEALGGEARGDVETRVVVGHADVGGVIARAAGEVAQGGGGRGLGPGGLVEHAVHRDGAGGPLQEIGGRGGGRPGEERQGGHGGQAGEGVHGLIRSRCVRF